jgi:GTP 3',8-cyclase
MSDKYKIDSHKLMYHVGRVNAWSEGDNIYPVYMEISPSGSCNHRCTYCGLDFMEYQRRFLETAILCERLDELGGLGLKSVMYAGEGEPFLNRDMVKIVSRTRAAGIDPAITTNAVLFKPEFADEILRCCEWVKVSINGATRGTYAAIHRTREEDFDRVITNLTYAAEFRAERNYRCTLGMQLLLLPENRHEAAGLAKLARDIGMDYLVIKPYSQHPQSKTRLYENLKYNDYRPLAEELAALNTERFSVIFRLRTMEKWDGAAKSYTHCLALPFWSYIDAGGNVWGCSVYLGDDRFLYGNIHEQAFEQIWQGEKRRESLRWVAEHLDTSQCRVNCRMDEINRYLWELKHPPEHVNFI